ncbi:MULTISPECIES: hypothetical protein [Tenacibaculum]|uniref:Bacteriocin n=1 Tax=Tenacibaculum aiptasiae TaxID=426481 RepID=A0A7J5AC45_9FLAO|nr:MULTISPECIES: hypothetical protein [Tenacibaculum]KAB1155152.1 hypothetical protein F7018_11780 [Tenacibaculum aiptasiae]MCF2873244.1 hypothetical protein [Tenacibaculum sp. Cn5-1]MCF2933400.1 hypothetical protein [Tenacibaculum sp. Cn5-34]MCG7510019.1 hypothetical protein [Tenacibaculum sp. Cn5-46]
MKKQILDLGKVLNKKDQQEIKGGRMFFSCADFCRTSWRDPAYYIQSQLELYGLDWSHCVC